MGTLRTAIDVHLKITTTSSTPIYTFPLKSTGIVILFESVVENARLRNPSDLPGRTRDCDYDTFVYLRSVTAHEAHLVTKYVIEQAKLTIDGARFAKIFEFAHAIARGVVVGYLARLAGTAKLEQYLVTTEEEEWKFVV